MKPFFQDQARQDALEREAQLWKGTRYFANAASRGHGVGCVELQHELWLAVGALTSRLQLPRYQVDYGHHATQGQLLEFLLNHEALRGRLVFVPVNGKHLPGDLFGCRSGRTDHHLSQMLPFDRVVHAVETDGVIIHDYSERKFEERVLYALRLMETP